MKRSLRERLQMYQMVHDLVENNQSIWGEIPKYTESYEQFTLKLNMFKDLLNEHQLQYSTGIKQVKDKYRKELAEAAMTVSRGLRTYGFLENKPIIEEIAGVTLTSLNKCSQVDMILKVDRLLHHAFECSDDLEKYGISSDQILDLQTKRDILAASYLAPRKAILKRKELGQTIQQLSKELDSILRSSLDNLTLMLTQAQPEYVKAYKNSRHVVAVVYTPRSSDQPPQEPDDGI